MTPGGEKPRGKSQGERYPVSHGMAEETPNALRRKLFSLAWVSRDRADEERAGMGRASLNGPQLDRSHEPVL